MPVTTALHPQSALARAFEAVGRLHSMAEGGLRSRASDVALTAGGNTWYEARLRLTRRKQAWRSAFQPTEGTRRHIWSSNQALPATKFRYTRGSWDYEPKWYDKNLMQHAADAVQYMMAPLGNRLIDQQIDALVLVGGVSRAQAYEVGWYDSYGMRTIGFEFTERTGHASLPTNAQDRRQRTGIRHAGQADGPPQHRVEQWRADRKRGIY